jgi:hypothetical protein
MSSDETRDGVRTWTLRDGINLRIVVDGPSIKAGERLPVADLPALLERLEGLAGVWKKRAAALEMRYDLDHSEPFPEGQVDGLEACADDLRNLLTTLRGEDRSDG